MHRHIRRHLFSVRNLFPLFLLALAGCSGGGGGDTPVAGDTPAPNNDPPASRDNTWTVTATAGSGGSISPASATVNDGDIVSFTLTPDTGYTVTSATGCNGSLSGDTYTTGPVTADCTITASFVLIPANPAASYHPDKILRLTWTDNPVATHYRLLEDPDGSSGFSQVDSDIPQGTGTIDHRIPLYARLNARYILQTCNDTECVDSTPLNVDAGQLAATIGYFKASNTGADDNFGWAVALSTDGTTLAVATPWEDSGATGVNSDASDDSAEDAGAVYVFTRSNGTWSQQAYLKASNTETGDKFGWSVALSADGNTLAAGAISEDSSATGINGDASDNSASYAGAVYVFTRSNGVWSQQAYLKASNTGAGDQFGTVVALAADGDTLAVGAAYEASSATGVNGNENDDSAPDAGAVYIFTRSNGTWSQQAYLKASNTDSDDEFGSAVALSSDGDTLAVGASAEDSNAAGIDGDESDNSAPEAGAVYVFSRSNDTWSQQAYLKASNSDSDDWFGWAVALSADGNTLAVSADYEDSNATGINGDESDNSAPDAGAVYVFTRNNGTWSQQAYLKASNTDSGDDFGSAVALSSDGDTLAVGATVEGSNATGINGNASDDSAPYAGAVYVFSRSNDTWSQQAYLKASNTDPDDEFGSAVALSGDGSTLAVGANSEESNAKGIQGDQDDDSASSAGAVYLY